MSVASFLPNPSRLHLGERRGGTDEIAYPWVLTRNRYLILLTIAPCFLTAAIYLSLSRIILIYGEPLARFKPRTYTIIFICCDIFSLVLQAIGGALADIADTHELEQTGIDIMIAGLSFQVVSLTVFAVLCADFAWSVRKKREEGSARKRKRALQARLGDCSVGRFYVFIWGESHLRPAKRIAYVFPNWRG